MNTEQLRAEFETWAQNSFELHRHSAGEYSSNFTQTAWAAWQARAALQSQDEDIFSPTSLTGLSKDELIRQLQWALNYWMPNIADDGTPDGERAAREAYLLLGMQAPVGREEENTPTYWERVSDLQSQDREDALVQAIQEAIALLGPEAPSCSGCEYEWNHALRVLHEAIDHARRIEGLKND